MKRKQYSSGDNFSDEDQSSRSRSLSPLGFGTQDRVSSYLKSPGSLSSFPMNSGRPAIQQYSSSSSDPFRSRPPSPFSVNSSSSFSRPNLAPAPTDFSVRPWESKRMTATQAWQNPNDTPVFHRLLAMRPEGSVWNQPGALRGNAAAGMTFDRPDFDTRSRLIPFTNAGGYAFSNPSIPDIKGRGSPLNAPKNLGDSERSLLQGMIYNVQHRNNIDEKDIPNPYSFSRVDPRRDPWAARHENFTELASPAIGRQIKTGLRNLGVSFGVGSERPFCDKPDGGCSGVFRNTMPEGSRGFHMWGGGYRTNPASDWRKEAQKGWDTIMREQQAQSSVAAAAPQVVNTYNPSLENLTSTRFIGYPAPQNYNQFDAPINTTAHHPYASTPMPGLTQNPMQHIRNFGEQG
jgi:hypothetical protein